MPFQRSVAVCRAAIAPCVATAAAFPGLRMSWSGRIGWGLSMPMLHVAEWAVLTENMYRASCMCRVVEGEERRLRPAMPSTAKVGSAVMKT